MAFVSQLDAGGSGLYTAGPVGSPVQKAVTGPQFSSLDSSSVGINAGGTVTFQGTATATGASEIYTAAPSGTVTRVATTQSGGGFVGLLQPSINAGGTVAFIGFPSAGVTSVYAAPPGGSPTVIASPGGTITNFAHTVPINAGGTVAFFASVTGGEGVYTLAPGGSPVQVANTAGAFNDFFNQGRVALNDAGKVAFVASLDAGGQGLYTVTPGGSPVEIANTAGPFSSFGSPSINALDVLTFSADLDAGGRDFYVLPPGGSFTRLIGTGDPLDGSTVAGFTFPSNRYALNDAGQIAFTASFADGRQGIFVATPVPEPTSLALLGVVRWRAILRRRRRRRSASHAHSEIGGRGSRCCRCRRPPPPSTRGSAAPRPPFGTSQPVGHRRAAPPNSATATATFAGQGLGTVNIGSNFTVQSLLFSNPTGSYTLASGTGVSLNGVTSITVDAAVTGVQTINLANISTGQPGVPDRHEFDHHEQQHRGGHDPGDRPEHGD